VITDIHKYTLPERYQEKIEAALKDVGYSLKDPRPIAESVLQLSTHYQTPSSTTPWSSKEFRAAYLAYFFPLNYIRNAKMYGEAINLKFPQNFSHFIDFGCGLGSSLLAAQDMQFLKPEIPIYGIDNFSTPLEVLKSHFLDGMPLRSEIPAKITSSFGVFSYSLNELAKTPSWLFDLEHLLILEPSTSVHARKLMDFRTTLLEKGFHIWAPCTHHEHCPLLQHSKRDWCHDRIHWDQPAWFQEIEKLLPIKNNTLTTSYLLASKTPPPLSAYGRIVGDELPEKGKTRWMFCRGENREFLSWLSRNGEAPSWKRGQLFLEPPVHELKGNELRLTKA
jgi:hypothetical protein